MTNRLLVLALFVLVLLTAGVVGYWDMLTSEYGRADEEPVAISADVSPGAGVVTEEEAGNRSEGPAGPDSSRPAAQIRGTVAEERQTNASAPTEAASADREIDGAIAAPGSAERAEEDLGNAGDETSRANARAAANDETPGADGARGPASPLTDGTSAEAAGANTETAGADGESASDPDAADERVAGTLSPGTELRPSGAVETGGDTSQNTSSPSVGTREAAVARDRSQSETADDSAGPSASGSPGAPTIDLLRAEPDGSFVIAGTAEPGSEIVLSDGARVIARERSGPSGHFVLSPTDPLPEGEHSLSLNARDGEGREEAGPTAVIAVPPLGRPGELLAMIQEPDRATRIVARPRFAPPASGGERDVTEPRENTPSDADADADADAGSASSAAPPSEPGADEPVLRVEAVEAEGDRLFIAGESAPGEIVRIYIDEEVLGETRGSANSRFLIERVQRLEPGEHRIRADQISPRGEVTARVEVPFDRPEERSFAAVMDGTVVSPPETEAPPPSASDREDTASPSAAGGGTAPVEPADGASGGEAVAASSPERRMAAREARQAGGTETRPSAEVEAGEPTGAGTTRVREPAALGRERSANREDVASLDAGNDRPAAPAEPDVTRDGEDVAEPSPASRVAAGEVAQASTNEAQPSAEASGREVTDAGASGQGEPAGNGREDGDGRSGRTGEVATKLQPSLTPADGSVIIRRGDSLWAISRRTYGTGNRFTTIYLANGDQIRDPDLIYPGQIFRLPGTDPDKSLFGDPLEAPLSDG